MPLYLVCIPPDPPPSPTLGKRLEDSSRLSDHILVWDSAYFVNAKVSVNEIAKDLGISPNGLGLVVPLEMGTLAGRANSEAVDWLRARSDKSAT